MNEEPSLVQNDYNISLEIFEGPLDLLLYLIKKEEVDIHDIPIEKITNQYLEYLNLMKILDLNIAGDFIVMSSTLMLIKSRMLLPSPERNEEEEEDPRWDLVQQLVEYKKFKDVAGHLEELENKMDDIFIRESDYAQLGAPINVDIKDANVFDLLTALSNALDNVKEEDLIEIFSEEHTVSQKINFVRESLRITQKLSITDLFCGMTSRNEIICTFLAVLELMKSNEIFAIQDYSFGSIVIKNVKKTKNLNEVNDE
tara:strand:- start:1956 stop:2723 length:768 start_codon:yes stop_codon:yes gene_type:complete